MQRTHGRPTWLPALDGPRDSCTAAGPGSLPTPPSWPGWVLPTGHPVVAHGSAPARGFPPVKGGSSLGAEAGSLQGVLGRGLSMCLGRGWPPDRPLEECFSPQSKSAARERQQLPPPPRSPAARSPEEPLAAVPAWTGSRKPRREVPRAGRARPVALGASPPSSLSLPAPPCVTPVPLPPAERWAERPGLIPAPALRALSTCHLCWPHLPAGAPHRVLLTWLQKLWFPMENAQGTLVPDWP